MKFSTKVQLTMTGVAEERTGPVTYQQYRQRLGYAVETRTVRRRVETNFQVSSEWIKYDD